MLPELLKIGKLTINGYGFMISLGIVAALILGNYRGRKRGMNTDIILDIAIYGVIGGVIGGKLLFMLTELPYIIKNPVVIKDMLSAGFVLYGAILGGALGVYILLRRKKMSFIKYFDLLAPSVVLAQGFGRIGCFFAGCCYGKPTNGPFGVIFRNSNYAPTDIHIHPTQIYSSLGDFAIAGILIYFASKPRKDGQVGGLYMILYSIGRFFIEFLRDDPRGNVGFFSTSQFICIFILICGIIIYMLEKIKAPASHHEKVQP
ncbi:MAG: prolipoprotein diacylglyceryl transferase [Clostridiales bacterium]|jgi:phosphatidylglycerol:prolipoprotein diacylglycerol transferase|nr:prolipoprotein diacylglyceryl transferase [Clostridiales bacterium]